MRMRRLWICLFTMIAGVAATARADTPTVTFDLAVKSASGRAVADQLKAGRLFDNHGHRHSLTRFCGTATMDTPFRRSNKHAGQPTTLEPPGAPPHQLGDDRLHFDTVADHEEVRAGWLRGEGSQPSGFGKRDEIGQMRHGHSALLCVTTCGVMPFGDRPDHFVSRDD